MKTQATKANKKPPPAKRTMVVRTPLVTALMSIPGGWVSCLDHLRDYEEASEEALRVVKVYDELPPPGKKKISPEKLCEMAEVSPAHFFGQAAEAMYELGAAVSKIIAGAAQPLVLGAMVREAKKAHGFDDRRLFLQSVGFAPTPNNSTNVLVNANSTANASADSKTLNVGLPSMEAQNLDFAKLVRPKIDGERTKRYELESPSAKVVMMPQLVEEPIVVVVEAENSNVPS